MVALDLLAQLAQLLIGQVPHLRIRVHSGGAEDLARGGESDPVDVGQAHLNTLIPRKIHACYSRQRVTSQCICASDAAVSVSSSGPARRVALPSPADARSARVHFAGHFWRAGLHEIAMQRLRTHPRTRLIPGAAYRFGLLQITRTTPSRRIIWHLSHNFRTDDSTFITVFLPQQCPDHGNSVGPAQKRSVASPNAPARLHCSTIRDF